MLAYINDRPVEFNEGETILAAAKRAGIFIPTLCELLPIDHTPGTCRVCLVEIRDGASSRITTACTTPIAEGMHVYTRTDTVRAMQKQQVKWLFSDHDQNCAACPRHGDCELQDAAVYVGLTRNPDNGNRKAPRPFDDSATALVRDASKCIRCMRCVEVCRKVQGLSALTLEGFGTQAAVGIAGTDKWGQSSRCVQCGQCTLVCPVGALAEKDQLDTALAWFNNPEIKTVVAFAPAVRVTLGEAFGMPLGENSEKRIVTALKQIGADFVCDINWAADVTIMEEGTELIDRIEHGGKLPMMTSCCPGWINFVEKVNPEVIENLSTTRSPQGIFGALAKTYFAKKKGVNPKKLRFISVMPCTAKKDEAVREQLRQNGMPDTDLVLTVREFARLLQMYGVDLAKTPESEFDSPVMSENTGAGVIFGATGGVMEAAIRTVHFILTGKELGPVEYEPVRGMEWIKEAALTLGKAGTVRIAVVHGLVNAQKLVDQIKAGTCPYHFIEVMACPGGCIDGGGTPRVKREYLTRAQKRIAGIYAIDSKRQLRQSHNNPDVQILYTEFLKEPCSETSHRLLHTHYTDRRETEAVVDLAELRKKLS